MIKASVAYEMMEKALHLIPSHESNSTYLSAYGVFNLESGDCVAVRAANHGTFLYNWLKMQDKPFNVDLLTSANIAITFLDGSIPFSQNNNIEMDNGAEPPVFVVRQYVYNCAVLDTNDINVIISASKKLIVDGVYTDPFEEDGTKHAIIYREKTNEPPKDVTAKTLKKHRAAKKKREQHTDNNQELNTEQYMNKKLIRLTESDLHRIVKESVNRILSEIDLIPNQSGGMRIADLKEFDFYIGNTRAGSDVVASNEGIFVDDELVNTYDPNVVINEPHDLIEAIDDAISFCPSKYIRKRDRDELGCYLGASLSIKDWWKENYG